MPMPHPIALACADIHLSHTPPPARAGEKSWYEAMQRPLMEMNSLARKLDVPVLCAGDVFDRYNPPPELINFAINELPHKMIAIPGQHDLPLHSLKNITQSAFWTMVQANKILALGNGCTWSRTSKQNEVVRGFPWGTKIRPPIETAKMQIALVHEYTWIQHHGYPGAPSEQNPLTKTGPSNYAWYNIVIIGDNHIPWELVFGKTTLFNPGTFMSRKSDDTPNPSIGIIYSNGTVKRHYLDNSKDVFNRSAKDETPAEGPELTAFLADLKKLHTNTLDYADCLKQVMARHHVSPEVRACITKAMEEEREI